MSRLARLKVRDFQSLASIDLELGQLTVIVGPNSVGKSSVVRALQAALTNWSGGDFVRAGQSKAEVALLFGDRWLIWRKPRRGGAEYEIRRDGESQIITRVGKDLPPEVQDLTGVREIRAEGVRATLQFAEQFELPFLLAATGGQAAKLLARVSKLDALVTGQVLARRDGERERRAAVAAEERAAELQEQLQVMPDYEALLERWREVSARLDEIVREERALAEGQVLIRQLRELAQEQERWRDKDLPQRSAQLLERATTLAEAGALVSRLIQGEAQVSAARTAAQAATARLRAAEDELHGVLADLEVCPLCGQVMPTP